jgi:hypothetical protein
MFLTRIRHSVALAGILRLVGVAAVVALFGFTGHFSFKAAVEATTRRSPS